MKAPNEFRWRVGQRKLCDDLDSKLFCVGGARLKPANGRGEQPGFRKLIRFQIQADPDGELEGPRILFHVYPVTTTTGASV